MHAPGDLIDDQSGAPEPGEVSHASAPADRAAEPEVAETATSDRVDDGPAGEPGQESSPSVVPSAAGNENVGALLRLLAKVIPERVVWRSLARQVWQVLILSPRSPVSAHGLGPVVAVTWAAGVGIAIGIALAVLGGAPDVVSAGAAVWLVANHIPLHVDQGTMSLLPLGLLPLALLPLRRAGRFCVGAGGGRAAAGLATGVPTYAVLATIVAAVYGGGHFVLVTVAPIAAVCAAVGLWWGLRASLGRRVRHSPVLRGTGVTVVVPLVLAVLLMLAAVISGWSQVADAQFALASGAREHVAVVLVQLAYLPNIIIWAGAYALGAGITMGPVTLSPFSSAGLPIVDLPVLAPMPSQSPGWAAFLPMTVAAGAGAAALLTNRGVPLLEVGRRMGFAAFLSAAVAGCWLVLSALAGGSVPGDRVDWMGPAGTTVPMAFLTAMAGGLVWALLPTVASDARPVADEMRHRVVRSKDSVVIRTKGTVVKSKDSVAAGRRRGR